MLTINELLIEGYEKVIEAIDSQTGLHCFIAVHNTFLGPSLGGTRIHAYSSRDDALKDALRLAKAMTYKSAVAEDGLGGGKSVIIANPKKDKTQALLLAFAEVVNSLNGKYIAAEDVGSSFEDMVIIHERTQYVASLNSGDPSRFTAWGVYQGLRAVAQHLWKNNSLKNRSVAIQGLGHVGSKLADILFWEGANLLVSDIDEQKEREYAHLYQAQILPKDKHFCFTECDILAPCAFGAIITPEVTPSLRCKAIAGGANNQLLHDSLGKDLFERGILYAPDFIINAGGILNVAAEFEPTGYQPQFVLKKVNNIYNILLHIFQQADQEKKSTLEIANKIAEYNLAHAIGKRQSPISFNQ